MINVERSPIASAKAECGQPEGFGVELAGGRGGGNGGTCVFPKSPPTDRNKQKAVFPSKSPKLALSKLLIINV